MSKATISVDLTDMVGVELTDKQCKITPLNDKMYIEWMKNPPRVQYVDGKIRVFIDREVDL